MKQFFLTIIYLSFQAEAAEFTLINHSNKASPDTIFAQGFNTAVNKAMKSEFYQAQNCEEAKQKFEKNDEQIMIYNANVGIAAMSKNLNCELSKNVTPDKMIFSGAAYYKICTSEKKPKDLKAEKVTLGMASVIHSKGLIEDYNKNGYKMVGVPFGGSKDVLTAVINGDIDFGIIGDSVANPALANQQIKCVFSTDPREANFVGKTIKLKIPDLRIWSIIYTNSADKKIIDQLRKTAQKDTEFNAYLSKNATQVIKTEGFIKKDIEDFKNWIKFNYETYWK